MFAGPLTYIVNNCIMQRDSQAGCSPVTAQMGEAFPAASACLLLRVRCEHVQPPAVTDRRDRSAGHCAPSAERAFYQLDFSQLQSTAFPELRGLQGGPC